MVELIEKIKEYKIIVICAGLGLVLGGCLLLKPSTHAPAKESNLQTEVTTVPKDSASEKEEKSQKSETEEAEEKDLITAADFGCLCPTKDFIKSVSAIVHTVNRFSPSMPGIGGLNGTEPVAMTRLS